VEDDVGLVDRQHRMSVRTAAGGQIPVPVDRDEGRHLGQLIARYGERCRQVVGAVAPRVVPEGVVLDIEEGPVDGPGKLLAKLVRVASTPVRPWFLPGGPRFWFLSHRQSGCEESPVVISELEAEVALDAVELRLAQPRLDLTAVQFGQSACGS